MGVDGPVSSQPPWSPAGGRHIRCKAPVAGASYVAGQPAPPRSAPAYTESYVRRGGPTTPHPEPAARPAPAPRFPVGRLAVGTYAGISTPPRAVVGATYVVERGRWRYRLAGEDFSRAEGELWAATTEATAVHDAARPGGVPLGAERSGACDGRGS
jgi:hypothetical protein